MSLMQRIRGAAHRRRERFRYEVMRPQMPVAEFYGELAPGLDVDLFAPNGFAQLWSAHMERTPRALWTVTPAASPEAVARVRRGEHALLLRTTTVTPSTDWQRDPIHGVSWPRVHVESCPFAVPGGDIEMLWHFNQMEFLLEYAAAYRTTHEGQFAARMVALMDSWARANPYMVGANWISPMKSGIRLFMWSAALAGITDAPVPDNETAGRILRSVQRQGEFLAGHFSNWAISNNHLIGEAAGLYVAARTWPCWARTGQWLRQAGAILEHEVILQNAADGVNREQAVAYQQFELDLLLAALLAARADGARFSENVLAR
ncbi:MAG TPA: heparinase II/III family protein, partial [Candidatus Krumholzibacteria bacterium]|nr:heparinase II/III family protein [Candidatus Krumholzibacteria bacterium]